MDGPGDPGTDTVLLGQPLLQGVLSGDLTDLPPQPDALFQFPARGPAGWQGNPFPVAGASAGAGVHAPHSKPVFLGGERVFGLSGPVGAAGPAPGPCPRRERTARAFPERVPAAAGRRGGPGKEKGVHAGQGLCRHRGGRAGTSPADGGGCEKRGGPSAQTNIAALSLPANGAAALRPGHRGARGAGIRHPAGQAPEPHHRDGQHSAVGPPGSGGPGEVQSPVFAQAVLLHSGGFSAGRGPAGREGPPPAAGTGTAGSGLGGSLQRRTLIFHRSKAGPAGAPQDSRKGRKEEP